MQKSSSETIFINFYTKIKLCLVLHTSLMFSFTYIPHVYKQKADDIVVNNNF